MAEYVSLVIATCRLFLGKSNCLYTVGRSQKREEPEEAGEDSLQR